MIGIVPYSEDLSHPADRRRLKVILEILGNDYEIANINKKYDFVFLTQNADLSLWVDYKLSPVIFDLCDAYLFQKKYTFRNIFHGIIGFFLNRFSRPYIFQTLLLEKCCKKFEIIICSSEIQRNKIINLNAKVFSIPDLFEIKDQKPVINLNKKIHILWEGLGISSLYLLKLMDLIKKNKKKIDVVFVVCSDNYFYRFYNKYFKINLLNLLEKTGLEIIFFKWSHENLIKASLICDLAVIPLNLNNEIVRYKNPNKLILMWKLGLITLTSPSPSYKAEMQNVGQSFSCDSKDWIEKIEYISKLNLKKKKELIMKTKRYINKNYSDKKIKELWSDVISSIKK